MTNITQSISNAILFELNNIRQENIGQFAGAVQKITQDGVFDYFSTFFACINKIDKYSSLNKKYKLAIGDTDGSMARIILALMVKNFAHLDQKQTNMLATLMILETAVAFGYLGFEQFQSSKICQTYYRSLSEIEINPVGQDEIIFLGDIIYDRLSADHAAIIHLIKKIKTNKLAIFILGNHDYLDWYPWEYADQFPIQILVQWGSFGAIGNKLDAVNFRNDITAFFDLAYYDQASNALYIHNGIKPIQTAESADKLLTTYQTAFGIFTASSAHELAISINSCNLNNIDTNHFTSFRPEDVEMSRLEFKIIHGHNAVTNNDYPNVYNLNARIDSYKYWLKPVAEIII